MKAAETYKICIDSTHYDVDDPIVNGQQVLDLAEKRPTDEHLLFLRLSNGQLEEIRLDETVDLRKSGIERFMTFKSDRSFRFSIDGRQFEWGAAIITGAILKERAGVDRDSYDIYLEVQGPNDRKIADTDEVDLTAFSVERFFTVKRKTTEG